MNLFDLFDLFDIMLKIADSAPMARAARRFLSVSGEIVGFAAGDSSRPRVKLSDGSVVTAKDASARVWSPSERLFNSF